MRKTARRGHHRIEINSPTKNRLNGEIRTVRASVPPRISKRCGDQDDEPGTISGPGLQISGSGIEASSCALQSPGQVPLDAGVGLLGSAPEEDHHNQCVGATYKKVYQGVLVHPVDLSQQASDAVALDATLDSSSRRESDLNRHVVSEGRPVHHPEKQADTADGHGLNVVPVAVKERADEPSPLEPVRPGKRVPPVGIPLVGAGRHGPFR